MYIVISVVNVFFSRTQLNRSLKRFLRYLLAKVLSLRSAAYHVATVMCYVDDEGLRIDVVWGQTVSNVDFHIVDACMWLYSS